MIRNYRNTINSVPTVTGKGHQGWIQIRDCRLNCEQRNYANINNLTANKYFIFILSKEKAN